MEETKLEYYDYLNLNQILDAQKPLSDEPLELVFIVAHQNTELWFKVLIQELNRLIEVPSDEHPSYNPTIQLDRIVKIFEHLTTLWGVLATMTPEEYAHFRFKLGNASGLQSKQYKEVKTLLKKLPKRWYHQHKHSLTNIENAFKKYQFAHMKTAERMIGNAEGTGGTTGVEYLKKAVDVPLFDNPNHEWKGW
tara:strand:+ start:203 stop:781 length:579 start_codon:yes stop_codon:yes gene_type:complete